MSNMTTLAIHIYFTYGKINKEVWLTGIYTPNISLNDMWTKENCL